MTVKVRILKNIFSGAVTELSVSGGRAVAELLPANAPHCCRTFLNGRAVGLDHVAKDGDELDLVLLPAGAGLGLALISAVALNAISLGIQAALTAPGDKETPMPTPEVLQPTRNPTGIHNTTGAGYPMAILEGEHRVGGHIIDRYERTEWNTDVTSGEEESILRVDPRSTMGTTKFQRIALGRGPIESISDILLDQNEIAEVRGVRYVTKRGLESSTNGSPAPRGFSFRTTEKELDQELVEDVPVVVETDGEVDDLELILRAPEGIYTRDAFDLASGIQLQVRVEFRVLDSGDAWTEVTHPALPAGNLPITDRSVGTAHFRIGFPKLPRQRYEVRVTRPSGTTVIDSLAVEIHDRLALFRLVEIESEERVHPGIAEIALEHLIEDQVGQLDPAAVTALTEGRRNVRVYSDTSTYTRQYSDNPAWLAISFILDSQELLGGLGDAYDDVDSFIDTFIAWAAYCDELVPDGRGGTEKRCRYGFPRDVQESAQTVLARYAFAGDAWILRDGGKWRARIDTVEPIVSALFSDANIRPGSLARTPVSPLALATRVTAQFTNAELDYAVDTLAAEDDTVVDPAADHIESPPISAWGITRPSHLARTLERLLRTNRYADTIIEFDTGIAGFSLRAGDVFAVASRSIGVGIASGRLVRCDGSTRLWLDDLVDLDGAKTYEVTVEHASGVIETKLVSSDPGTDLDWIDVSGAWVESPASGDQYTVGETELSRELYRCTSITQGEDYTRHVRGLKYDVRVYERTEIAVSAPVSAADDGRLFPGPVVALIASAEGEGSVVLSWDAPTTGGSAAAYVVFWRLAEVGPWIRWGRTSARSARVRNLRPGTLYDFAVVAETRRGNRADVDDATTASATVA